MQHWVEELKRLVPTKVIGRTSRTHDPSRISNDQRQGFQTERPILAAEGCGSINEVGWRFHRFGINDLKWLDQTGIEPVTS